MFQVAMERLIAPNIVDLGPISTQETLPCRWMATKAATSRIAAATGGYFGGGGGGGGFGGIGGIPMGGGGGLFKGGLGLVAFIVIALIFGADPLALLSGMGGGGTSYERLRRRRPAAPAPRQRRSRPAMPRPSSCRAC